MSTPRQDPLLPLPTLALLLGGLAVVAAPHALRMPFWITALAVLCGIWRYQAGRRGDALPPAWLRTLLTVATAVGIFASYGNLLGRDAGTALLVAMTGLKLLEMRRRRDTHVVLYLGYFLVGTQFLYTQSIPMALYLLASVWVMTVLLIAAHQASAHPRPWIYAGRAAAMIGQALPIMLVLFVLFPRISGPLWGLPKDAHGASTGMSDRMSPGDISSLSQSDAVAFRVDFHGVLPPPEQRYWRGYVFDRYDGRTWDRGAPSAAVPPLALYGEPVSYSVLLQPHQQRILFALDIPSAPAPDAAFDDGLEMLSREAVNEPIRYRLDSYPAYRLQPVLPRHVRQRNLALPPGAHPKARALAAEWRAETADPAALLRHAVDYIRGQPFVYTLTPPRLEGDTVDQFLFETQRGFCEHYAGAFVVLMRAAGVPARVVAGYQGGEINPLGDYLIVRQSDAHAWAEVWLPERGWTRVDPTALVAPERIELGLAGAVPEGEPIPAMARLDADWLKQLRLGLDAVNTGWNRWVLAYGPELQQQFLGRFGIAGWQRMTTALGAALTAVVLVIALTLLVRNRPRRRPPLARLYEGFCRRLARRGLPRRPSEAPGDFAARVAAARPELAEPVAAITRLYVRLRYEDTTDAEGLRALRDLIRRFRP